jgi:MoaA/NifB/PqqE/SkfB family radical SAM enzyme
MIGVLQRFMPQQLKNLLKPYYRSIFPDRLHIVFWTTFRCNYKCSYCSIRTQSDMLLDYPKSAERTVAEWLRAFNKFPPAAIYFSGGEPFLLKGMPDLINGLSLRHDIIGAVTNLSAPSCVYKQVNKPMHLNVSFHREYTDQSTFLAKINELKEKFHITVNFVATPDNLTVLSAISKFFTDNGVAFHVDPYCDNDSSFKYTPDQMKLLKKYLTHDRNFKRQSFLASDNGKKCSAGRNYITLMPDGSVYTCSGGMLYHYSALHKEIRTGLAIDHFSMSNIFYDDFRLNEKDIICTLPCKYACDYDAAIIQKIQ